MFSSCLIYDFQLLNIAKSYFIFIYITSNHISSSFLLNPLRSAAASPRRFLFFPQLAQAAGADVEHRWKKTVCSAFNVSKTMPYSTHNFGGLYCLFHPFMVNLWMVFYYFANIT